VVVVPGEVRLAGIGRAAALRDAGEAIGARGGAVVELDLVVATDVLYSHEAVSPLVETLVALSSPKTQVLLAAGRNQHAGEGFWAAARAWFEVHEVSTNALHAAYRCDDVTVWRLQRFEKS
jgi:predicted nicotinamide N-methyase